ncbi:antA/AntB antirepressor family protein [Tenacibaculum sp. C7A-26P2]|uniref:antA/AntB antirepressor family protein n=1 Tax=Tenacibaculum sp. C7A-26P2 TaxID=3447504 RepID=UPI003F875166
MKNLIEIKNENGKQVVSARELYEFLGFAIQHWSKWYKKNILKNPFAFEKEDYTELPLSGRTRNFALSIDFAKKLSMLARTEQGERARNYFLEVEQKYNSTNRIADPMELVIQIAQNSIDLKKKQEVIEQDVSEIKEEIKVLKEKNETDPNFFTIVGYASLLGKQINLEFAKKLGKEASKICRERNIELSSIPVPRFGRVKTYPQEILETVFLK